MPLPVLESAGSVLPLMPLPISVLKLLETELLLLLLLLPLAASPVSANTLLPDEETDGMPLPLLPMLPLKVLVVDELLAPSTDSWPAEPKLDADADEDAEPECSDEAEPSAERLLPSDTPECILEPDSKPELTAGGDGGGGV